MSKGRLTIGYLSETSFEATTMQMLEGALKAAEERDVNLVYFAMEHENRDRTYKNQLEYIYNILERVPVDGLFFLGWSMSILKNEPEFLKRIQNVKKLPVVSIGTKIENVPSVIIDTEKQLNELLSHLHDFHGYKNISFIQPFSPDDRYECYVKFMKSRGIFKPELVVRSEEIFIEKDYYGFNRAKKSIDILFDERKVKPEAILSMYSYEASHLIDNLAKKGYKVPDDVAIASWEDGDIGKYATPSITSVYYPFFEIGYEGCKKTVDLIEGNGLPGDMTVQATMNIRNSCGCRTLDELKVFLGGMPPDEEEELSVKYEELKDKSQPGMPFPLRALSGEKLLSFMKLDEDNCLDKLEDYILRTLKDNDFHIYIRAINTIHEIQKEILWFYSFVHSNTSDPGLKSGAVKMVLKVLFILQQKTEEVLIYNEELKSGSSDLIQDASQNIVNTYDIKKVNITLLENMRMIGSPNYFLFFNLHSTGDFMLKGRGMAYNIRNGVTSRMDKLPADFGSILLPDNARHVYYLHILHIKSKLLGFIFFEPGQTDDRVYYSFSIQLASALYGSMTLDSLKTARDEIAENLKVIHGKTIELEESNSKLSQLDNLKNDFITNVTHDFRNPLTVILNLADLSLKYPGELSDLIVTDRFNTIYSASLSLKHSIDQLLDIARIDARGMKIRVRKIPLRSYMSGIIDFYRSAASTSGIRIIKDLPEKEVDNFFSDQEKLDEILHNIVSNALKFVEPGSGIIKIILHDSSDKVIITIEDNGIGIPKDKLEFIFGRFEQIQSQGSGRVKGTGIGLSFARQLVELLKGSLQAQSEGPGKGSRFIAEFKKGRDIFDYSDKKVVYDSEQELVISDTKDYYRQLVRGSIDEKMAHKTHYATINNPNLEHEFDPFKANIMIVDDNARIHDILKSYLSNWGYSNFIHAYDGADGLEAVYKYKPDLIICDYNMPKMRGDQMQDRLLKNPEFRLTPIIFLSAVADKSLIMKGKEKGAIVYLNKPIDEKELMVNVEYFIMKQMEFKQLLMKSSVDELTGLANKRSITGFLNDHIMIRSFRPISLIMMDIDNFKTFNDNYGHLTGDEVVINVGRCIKNTIRNYDRAGRFGGDEFMIVLPETSIEEAGVVAEKIKDSITGKCMVIKDNSLKVTASIGISSLIDNEKYITGKIGIKSLREIYEIKDKRKADWERINGLKRMAAGLLIESADIALYRAKEGGRDRIELFKG